MREREKQGASRLCVLAAALFIAALFPAAAGAETRSFVNVFNLFPTGGALTNGPANKYPSSIAVSGVAGTVTNATVTLIGLSSSSPDDIDAVIVGPNGQKVMLMSDACGVNPSSLQDDNWTFDDSASTFLSDGGPCGAFQFQDESFRPTNYENPDLDDLTPGGGPAGPYLNSLSLLAGGSPDGAWNLFVFDDNASFHGFDLSAWALNLEIQPPPAGPAAPQATGQQAAALAKCKAKKTKKARRKCRQKAQSLPL
jgi:hypothetical protein